MPYVVDQDGAKVPVPISSELADVHSTVYASGALGNFIGNYHFRMELYRDSMPSAGKTWSADGETVDVSQVKVIREIVTTVYMSPAFTKELMLWLQKKVTEYEAGNGPIKLTQGKEDTPTGTKDE